jgi:hypothetical protein
VRITAWIAGSLLGVIITAYLVAVAINLRDRPPSEEAIRLADAYRNRPPVADSDNAYVYLMGFSVAPEEDPFAMGLKRVSWMKRASEDGAALSEKDPIGERPDIRHRRPQLIQEFMEACRSGGVSDCADAFASGDEVFDRWIATERWLLERYRTLIAHAGWMETVPFDVSAPLPDYALVMDGQRMHLLDAMSHARRGDHRIVESLLAQDVRFWRRVLESSDLLISKMIATAAGRRIQSTSMLRTTRRPRQYWMRPFWATRPLRTAQAHSPNEGRTRRFSPWIHTTSSDVSPSA